MDRGNKVFPNGMVSSAMILAHCGLSARRGNSLFPASNSWIGATTRFDEPYSDGCLKGATANKSFRCCICAVYERGNKTLRLSGPMPGCLSRQRERESFYFPRKLLFPRSIISWIGEIKFFLRFGSICRYRESRGK